ncbi:GNAT family N-acetyltransferase [Sulfitobacter sp. LCG007]
MKDSEEMQAGFISGACIKQLFPLWKELFRRDPDAQVFSDPEFLSGLIEDQEHTVQFLVAWDSAGAAGILPCRITHEWEEGLEGFRTELSMAARAGWADYTAPIVDPRRRDAALRAMSGELAGTGWGRLRLANLRLDEKGQEALFSALEPGRFERRDDERRINGGETDNLLCPAIDLPESFDTYLATLGRNTRQKLRRLLRMLDGGEVQIRHGSGKADIAILVENWARTWAGKPGVREKADRYGEILLNADTAGLLSLPMLVRNGQVIAAIANLVDRTHRRISFFVSGRDPDVTDIPAGFLLHADAIRRAISEGFETYDFLRGDEAYKMQLGAKPVRIDYITFRRLPADGRGMQLSPLSLELLAARIPELIADGQIARAETAARQVAFVIATETERWQQAELSRSPLLALSPEETNA